MKKILLALCLLPSVALADTCAKNLIPIFAPLQAAKLCSTFSAGTIGVLANNTFAVARNAANDANINVWKVDASDDTMLNADTGDVINLAVATTPVAVVAAAGLTLTGALTMSAGNTVYSTAGTQPKYPAAAVITPSTSFPTPAAGDTLTQRYTILAAAAPTASFIELPVATANVGKTYTLFNQSSNPGAIVPQGADTQGVAVANTPFACTTLKSCDCTALTTGNWMCGVR